MTHIPLRSILGVLQIGIKSQDTVMSDSKDSTVTYTAAPPSPDYVLGPEYPPSLDFVPEPVYPEFMPPEDEVLPDEEQSLLAAVSPTADSPGYVPESDPKEYPEEDDDENPEEDPVDYPADGGDDGDDEDESSDDDEDDDVDIKGGEEEEEHPALADSTAVALPTDVQSKDSHLSPFWSEAEVAPKTSKPPSPPPSPLSLWSSPLPQIPSPPLPVSPPPASPTYPLGYRAAMIRLRAEAPSTSYSPPPHIILSHTRADTPPSGTPPLGTPPLLPIPLPTSSPPLHLLSTDRRADRPEVTLSPWKRLGIAFGSRYEVGESSSSPTARPPGGFRADYGFVATMDKEIMQDLERDVGYGITDTWDEMLDTDEIYVRLDDEQTERQLMAGRLNMLYRDRRAHARITLLMEREARMSREAWGRSMDASDLARSEVMSLHTTVLGQQAMITELQAADHRRQAAITELVAADHRRQA
ncbi:hypothetical protein Tco_0974492 [Tanacetum coccineum]|uniref:Uncharacterized protein n=1 Tax=Tanacetum coccineum TaxID=301880 RepID=A0ABQ5EBQ5_9ASTR